MSGGEHHRTRSPEETEELGERFSERLRKGDTVALVGELGGGKTRFVRGVARGLGCQGYIKSPSFTLVNIYEGGRFPLYHIDLYRLSTTEEFADAGLEEYIYSEGVTVIEWADRLPELMKECAVVVRFTHAGTEERDIEIDFLDERARDSKYLQD